MATLQQIYVNLIGGVAIAILSFGLFGIAIRKGYTSEVAPRSWSRPPEILLNVLVAPMALSWIFWSWRQTYPDLLAGIPGTGTRSGGWAGPTLKVNLDGIIMLKYHVLLLKVAVLATVLCTVVILPINVTATCDPRIFGRGTCQTVFDLTDFERTTISNIPPLSFNGTISSNSPLGHRNNDASSNGEEESLSEGGTMARYVGIALVSWGIYWYICHLLWKEWIENLGLRRAFFLEYDHYKQRRDELNDATTLKKNVPEDPGQPTRHPWLPHPELRETVPNISLYTAIYKLPSQIETDLPDTASDLERQLSAAVDFFDQCIPKAPGFSSSVVAITILPDPAIVAQAWKKWYYCGKKLRQLRYIRQRIQLLVERQHASEDELTHDEDLLNIKACMEVEENQSRKTDSFQLLSAMASEKRGDVVVGDGGKETNETIIAAETKTSSTKSLKDLTKEGDKPTQGLLQGLWGSVFNAEGKDETTGDASVGPEGPANDQISDAATVGVSQVASPASVPAPVSLNSQYESFKYIEFDIEKCAKEIGFSEDVDLSNAVSGIGIEQLSVYAREYAQSSSSTCPFGFAAEGFIRLATLDNLRAMEKEAIERVRQANEELVAARRAVDIECSGTREVPLDPFGVDDAESYDPAVSKKEDEPTSSRGLQDRKPRSNLPASEMSKLRPRGASSTSKTWHQAQVIARSISQGQREISKKTSLVPAWMKGRRHVARPVARQADPIVAPIARDSADLAALKIHHILDLRYPAYAVVTFTSRQAAVAARQCLADGSGVDNWVEIKELPVPPLADAPPCDIMFCRGCCRPVTLTISKREKKIRHIAGVSFFLFFCFFYTLPLSLVSQLLKPETLAQLFLGWDSLKNPNGVFYTVLAGISSGFLYTLFFSFCPQLFKAIANFEGNVSSMQKAEDKALQYFWYFMMLTAFTGTSLTQMFTEVFWGEGQLGTEIKDVLAAAANSIPTQQAPVWVNWLIVRFTYTLPFFYLLQANTFGFRILRWEWCGRLMRGGGPGGPPPYRILVDAGTAHMCVVAIAPVCPLIAPLGMVYFMVMLLMLRWLLVFVYRPSYDAGGNRWPALHEIIVSSTIYGQVLVATILGLKNAFYPMVMIAAAIVPTYMFSRNCKHKFLQAYIDAGLWQTSHLDRSSTMTMMMNNNNNINNNNDGNTMDSIVVERNNILSSSDVDREEYRRWLVDCHKASYVPICLAGSESLLTIEHAILDPTTPTTTVAS